MKYTILLTFFLYLSAFTSDAQQRANQYGVVNLKGEIIVPMIYEEIIPFGNGYARTMRRERYGLIDSQGKEILECKYHGIQEVVADRIIVMMNKSYGVIDLNGNTIIPITHKSIIHLTDGYFLAYKTVTCGVYNNKGEITVPFSNDILMPFSGDRHFLLVQDYIKGSNKIIDCNNTELKQFTNTHTQDMGNGYLGIETRVKNTYRIIDIDAHLINEAIKVESNQIFDGDYLCYMSEGKLGLIHISGKQILLPAYKRIYDFEDGHAKVVQDSTRFGDNQYGVIDTDGKEIVRCMYDGLGKFSNGRILALAQQKYGYLNKNGMVAIPFRYDSAIDFEDNIAIVSQGRHYGVIDTHGNQILPFEFDQLKYLGKERFAAYQNGKWKIIGKENQAINNSIYDAIGYVYADNYITASANRKWGIIDHSGALILPFQYSSVQLLSNETCIVHK